MKLRLFMSVLYMHISVIISSMFVVGRLYLTIEDFIVARSMLVPNKLFRSPLARYDYA
jgi:hypothetical protein